MFRLVLLAAAFIAALAPTAYAEEWKPQITMEATSWPNIGETVSIPVGKALYRKLNEPKVDGAILGTPVTVQWSSSTPAGEFPAGHELFTVRATQLIACNGFYQNDPVGCFFDDDDDGRFDRTKLSYVDWLGGSDKLTTPVPYKRARVVYMGPGAPPVSEIRLLYLGSDGSSLRIGKRAYRGSTLLQVEDYTVPLGPAFPQPFGVGDLAFTLVKVDGMGITVRLEK